MKRAEEKGRLSLSFFYLCNGATETIVRLNGKTLAGNGFNRTFCGSSKAGFLCLLPAHVSLSSLAGGYSILPQLSVIWQDVCGWSYRYGKQKLQLQQHTPCTNTECCSLTDVQLPEYIHAYKHAITSNWRSLQSAVGCRVDNHWLGALTVANDYYFHCIAAILANRFLLLQLRLLLCPTVATWQHRWQWQENKCSSASAGNALFHSVSKDKVVSAPRG